MKIYRQIKCSDRLPSEGWVLTPSGAWMFYGGKFKCPHDGTIQQGIEYWLEEIELPSGEEVKENVKHGFNWDNPEKNALYSKGVDNCYSFILDKILK